jgi:hypothetical protein
MSLHLQRLRVDQLRQFRSPFELAGLEPGLNIISGPNEAGKSTLVRAIRAAFFERHRSTAVDDLRPWGDPTASPTVELDFRLAGQVGHLSKTFFGKKRCQLSLGGQHWDGVDAEDHLAHLLGFSFAARGASQEANWGIPGLLWIEQGSGQQLDVSHARDHLHMALQQQAGQDPAAALAATDGDSLLAQLRAQRNALLTGTGKPREDLAKAIEQLALLQARLAMLDGQIAQYQQQVDQLATLQAEQTAQAQQRPDQALRSELAAAQARQQALQQREQQLVQDRARHQQLLQTRQLWQDQLTGFAQQAAAAQARDKALESAGAQLQQADAALATARQQAAAAQARSRLSQQALRSARQQAHHLSLSRQVNEAQAASTQLQQVLQRAQAEHQQLQQLRQAAASGAAVAPTPAGLKQLRQLDAAVRELAVQRQGVATRLRFVLPPGQQLSLSSAAATQTLSAQGELWLDAEATLQLPGGGELSITPGGQDLAAVVRQLLAAQQQLDAGLQRFGVADLAQAEARLLAHSEQQAQITLAQQALAIVAPQGLDGLQEQAAQLAAKLAAAQQALAAAPPIPDTSATSDTSDTSDNAPSVDSAELAYEAASQTEHGAQATLAQAQARQASALSQQQQAQRERDTAQAALSDPARQHRQVEAQQQLLAQGAEADALAARIAQAEAALREARPDILAQDLVRLQRSLEQWERSQVQRREQILLLQNSLQKDGALGLEEQRDGLAVELTQARRRETELRLRAAALDLLCTKLDQQRQATLTRLQAPLQHRLQHYLPLLMPGASLQVGDDLAPGTLTRPGRAGAADTGQVEALSFGAREQLGLISRFAYADLLQEAGRPTLLILDDALVHSDAVRLAQMKRVIYDAAQRHQVLLFTCHPDDWQDLGVAVRSLP